MAPLRKTIPVSELRESREERGIDDSKYATTYRASRGGHFPDTRPQPGQDTDQRDND